MEYVGVEGMEGGLRYGVGVGGLGWRDKGSGGRGGCGRIEGVGYMGGGCDIYRVEGVG